MSEKNNVTNSDEDDEVISRKRQTENDVDVFGEELNDLSDDSDDETFCTNESTCGIDKQCSCLEGWEGNKCEVEVMAASIQGGDAKWSGARLTGPSSVILFLIISSMTLVVM